MSEKKKDGQDFTEIYKFVHFSATYGTLALLIFLLLFLINTDFVAGTSLGLRSLAASLFPIVIGSFIFAFNRELLEYMGSIHASLAFLISSVVGGSAMFVLQWTPPEMNLPLAELISASSFSLLVFSSGALKQKETLAYYYGYLSGVLLYVILVGVPLLD